MLLSSRIVLTLLLALTTLPALADEDNTRRLLNQIDRSIVEREQSYLPQESPNIDTSSLITIDGTTYSVQPTLEDLGPAIYVSLNLRQWEKVRQFLDKYRTLPGHETALVAMAEGLLAREVQDYPGAIEKLNTALEEKPDFVRAKMELARVLFEDNQSREARALFGEISTSGIPEEARPVIEGFQYALNEREAWHGSFSVGVGYNSNINQENGRKDTFQVCYFFGCFPSTRKMPDPIQSSSLVYDLTLNRRVPLSGHHNILLRGISYGNFYRKHKEADPNVYYNDNTSIVYAGYNYLDARHDIAITPLFENYYSNRSTLYQAAGLRFDWKYNLTRSLQVGFNAQHKQLHFKGDVRQYFDNYNENQVGVYGSYMLNQKTALFGGLNYTRKLRQQAAARSKEYMGNIGIYRMFDAGFNVNAVALYRYTRNDEADLFLGGRRKDNQQIYIVNIGMPRFAFKGIVPNLYMKRTVNNSSIDWAYEYRQTEVALKLEKRF